MVLITDFVQGEALSAATPISFHYTRNFRPGQSLVCSSQTLPPPLLPNTNNTTQVVSDDLIASDADGEPPSSYTRDLINVCTLTTDLGAVPKSLFTRLTTTRGVEFDNLDFTLEMVVESAGLAFELKVDGFRYGRVEAEFH
jgi:hypothetical protein